MEVSCEAQYITLRYIDVLHSTFYLLLYPKSVVFFCFSMVFNAQYEPINLGTPFLRSCSSIFRDSDAVLMSLRWKIYYKKPSAKELLLSLSLGNLNLNISKIWV